MRYRHDALVSPIAWDHYFLLLLLPLAFLWRYLPATGLRVLVTCFAIILLTVNPKWVWDATIPGDGELAVGRGVVASVATPLHAVTALSYQFYTLLALFLFPAAVKPALRTSISSPPVTPPRDSSLPVSTPAIQPET